MSNSSCNVSPEGAKQQHQQLLSHQRPRGYESVHQVPLLLHVAELDHVEQLFLATATEDTVRQLAQELLQYRGDCVDAKVV